VDNKLGKLASDIILEINSSGRPVRNARMVSRAISDMVDGAQFDSSNDEAIVAAMKDDLNNFRDEDFDIHEELNFVRRDRFGKVKDETQQAEFGEADQQVSSDDEGAMDDFEHEEVSDQGSKRKSKKKGLHGDDEDEEEKDQKILMDNLPQTEEEIRRMMIDCRREMKRLEV
jgi:hypothetical protein